ncbi:Uncharacterised protein [Comamonas aquatica]|nr:Uncharacterised protein [Comamonas aquatica]
MIETFIKEFFSKIIIKTFQACFYKDIRLKYIFNFVQMVFIHPVCFNKK